MAASYSSDGMNNVIMIDSSQSRDRIMENTWGRHKPGNYPVKFLVYNDDHGRSMGTIRMETPKELHNSFFAQDYGNFFFELDGLKEGAVYWWIGTYTLYKNAKCRFAGKLIEVIIPEP